MKELLAGLAIIIRDESIRNNFSEQENLWREEEGESFTWLCIVIRRFKKLIRFFRFDKENNFVAVNEFWGFPDTQENFINNS